jgi:chorismate mutase
METFNENGAAMSDDIQSLRASLDRLDGALLYLLAERFQVTEKVGVYKVANGLPAVDPEREKQQFERMEELAGKAGLDPDFAQKMLRLIIDKVVEDHKSKGVQ